MSPLADIALGLVAGVALGAVQLAWLWASVRRPGGPGAGRLLLLAAARIGLVLAGLWLVAGAAERPAAALLAAIGGLLIARRAAIRLARPRAPQER